MVYTIGPEASVSGENSTAIGFSATASGRNSILVEWPPPEPKPGLVQRILRFLGLR